MANSFLELRTLAFVLVLITIILSAAMFFVWRKHFAANSIIDFIFQLVAARVPFFL